MTRILILFAHPALEKSRVHSRLIRRVPNHPEITFHDLYEAYPAFDVDIAHEQELLTAHDLIVLQHPFFWYSTPPLVKQWEDLVLEHGWAYGTEGTALRGKRLLSLVTTGGQADAYQADGYNRYTVRQLLAPIEQTAYLCGMEYLPPYLIQGSHRMTTDDIEQAAAHYEQLMTVLQEDRIDYELVHQHATMNAAVAPLLTGGVSA